LRRHIHPGEILYVDLPRDHVIRLVKELKDSLDETDIKALKEIAKVKKQVDPFWASL